MPDTHVVVDAPCAPRNLSRPPLPAPLFATPSFAIWQSEGSAAYPRPKLRAAWKVIGANLWAVMRSEERWWNTDNPLRCIWASCAAAVFLSELGFKAEVVSAGRQVFLTGPRGITERRMTLGFPEATTGHPGLHNVVLVSDGRHKWLLETSVWQARRRRFGQLPDLMLVEVQPQPPAFRCSAGFSMESATSSWPPSWMPAREALSGWAGRSREHGQLGTRRAMPVRSARAVARKLEAIRIGRGRLVGV